VLSCTGHGAVTDSPEKCNETFDIFYKLEYTPQKKLETQTETYYNIPTINESSTVAISVFHINAISLNGVETLN
jgi:hypothetical protein